MLLTTKVGAAMAATAAASFVAGATLHPNSLALVNERPGIVQSQGGRAAKADRLDLDMRVNPRRMACLNQDWLKLSQDCVALFQASAQAPAEVPRTTTVIVRDGVNSSVAIRVPRPESELTFR